MKCELVWLFTFFSCCWVFTLKFRNPPTRRPIKKYNGVSEHNINTKMLRESAAKKTALQISSRVIDRLPELKSSEVFSVKENIVIVIPYRDRAVHYKKMMEHLPSITRKNWTIHTILVEQFDKKPFKRAWLMNIGIAEAKKRFKEDKTCVVTHDIDMIADSKVDYGWCDRPTQICSELSCFDGGVPYSAYAGGVVQASLKDWYSINGFTNVASGWGGEDDDLHHRFRLNGLLNKRGHLRRPAKEFGKCHCMNDKHHTKRVRDQNGYQNIVSKINRMSRGSDEWKSDGLNSLKYHVSEECVDEYGTINLKVTANKPNDKAISAVEDITVHMVWVTPFLRGESNKSDVQKCFDSWKSVHSDVILWTNNKVREEFPELVDLLTRIPVSSWSSNILRYAVLEKYGGLYVDTDVLAYRSIVPLVNKHPNGFFVCEAPRNRFPCTLIATAVLYLPQTSNEYKPLLQKAISESKRILSNINYKKFQYIGSNRVTGPPLPTKMFKQHLFNKIDLLSSQTFFPCDWSDKSKCVYENFKDDKYVFGIHLWNKRWEVSREFPTGTKGTQKGATLQSGNTFDDTSDVKVHICVAADKSHDVGISALIRSIKKNTKTPDDVIFHKFSLDSEYSLQDVQPYINSKFSATHRGNLKAPANYVRFILAQKLPQVDACWWIDADVIVQGDIVEYTKNINLNKLVATFPRDSSHLSDKVYSIMKREGLIVSSSKKGFNAGIIYLNLALWRERNIDTTIRKICAVNSKYSIWTDLGSQPPLQLVAADDMVYMDTKNYEDGLGWRKGLTISPKTMFLHWNGPHKPWLPKGQYKDFWEPFSDVKVKPSVLSEVDLIPTSYGMWPSETIFISNAALKYKINIFLESGTANGVSTQHISQKHPEIPFLTYDRDDYKLFKATKHRLQKCCPNVKTYKVNDGIFEIETYLKDHPDVSAAVIIDGPKGQQALKAAKSILKYPNVRFIAIHDTAPCWDTFKKNDWDIPNVDVEHSWTSENRAKYEHLDMDRRNGKWKYDKTGPGVTLLKPQKKKCYTISYPQSKEKMVKTLIELEQRFGGLQQGNVPCQHLKVLPGYHGTTKCTGGDRMKAENPNHNYAPTYAEYLHRCSNIKSVAEIGILKGSGIAMWSILYPNATIHGFDLNLDNTRSNFEFLKSRGAFCSENLFLHELNQLQINNKIDQLQTSFDLVIDDAYHTDDASINTWKAFEPHLNANAIYIVEDCECKKLRHIIETKYKEYSVDFRVTSKVRSGSYILVITKKKIKNQKTYKKHKHVLLTDISKSIGWHKWCEQKFKPIVSRDEQYYLWADKHAVKELVRSTVSDVRVAVEYAHVNKSKDITHDLLESLPNKYFMKATHMSGGIVMVSNGSVKCLRSPCDTRRKGEDNVHYLQRLCSMFLKNNYGNDKGELWYGKIKRKCIFEESFPEAAGKDFKDYKIWVLNGRVVFVQIDSSRHVGTHLRDYVTPAWKKIPMKDEGTYGYKSSQTLGEMPPFWKQMLENSERLAKTINSVSIRVDFFGFAEEYAFAEISFAHDSCKRGKFGFIPTMADKYYGFMVTHPDKNLDPEIIIDILSEAINPAVQKVV